jgi:hypothetical protein
MKNIINSSTRPSIPNGETLFSKQLNVAVCVDPNLTDFYPQTTGLDDQTRMRADGIVAINVPVIVTRDGRARVQMPINVDGGIDTGQVEVVLLTAI